MQQKFLKFDKVWYCEQYSYPAIIWSIYDNEITIYKYALGMWSKKIVNINSLKKRDIDISDNIIYYRKKVLEC